ncbi:type II toxin-antitoxin system VapC family toxin [Sphingomonas sp. H39-1-10]|uniref:type II toxin-antitoxin system VapC family toxin n=1 Tax=Sphingomonas TaxID=13687 RepID=UPI000888203A|nr:MULTISPECIES: type II toxin-antitoxin system VapC family toxin [Sphingomonas]MDF0486971.1 type II toxin-antitoxin system VapC family toxin [Sphingomonas pollutisoli]SDA27196.1 Uncharacterized protein, contains PIN domain [Sphingomonas sp. NFR15]
MKLFVDASALVAIMTQEQGYETLMDTLDRYEDRLYCATGTWEAVRAISRIRMIDIVEASDALRGWLENLGFQPAVIGDAEERFAVEAHRLYGKGTGHPAQLNMGDCFAYACAKTNGARLLYKGDDFSHTDLA